ncbi:hypothetical protein G3545_29240 [Starkeya sp. ORNL1]|uniref:hypothetical protein n=1 Tax=Starkeya sp. ORNL1 TaxID=2709380 RepID=UPI001462B5A4|nr:hypothetical protein [Starkeya sp. ORNL1]QJP17368.1 hypothetical protein G3545_29240 [Starkeya sp. ORNL1]
METFYQGRPNSAELKVMWVIERKTFGFKKLFEKIPRRFFVQGQKGDGESWVIRPSGMDDRAFSKGRTGLIDKELITCRESTPHPMFGPSSAYCLGRGVDLFDVFFAAMCKHLEAECRSSEHAEHLIEALGAELVVKCGDL